MKPINARINNHTGDDIFNLDEEEKWIIIIFIYFLSTVNNKIIYKNDTI